ncbi:hypothetical protein B0T26DRAFT_676653 [Lasiosphaeria miniovina]|uniref:Mid2 domain-containing protein n=1 Tax=Lasiosphaeria miniovina TaxID=1954250 RepID=A0AA40AMF5_9PEZI|nr:uncharacterized protein B0T26DRAFT_676653 [Lasiosphaeria miniovina]KAK0718494.1 hypothetical protein B0T26DRAFT_676653 [Lasiosphaeria miniovina]
MASERVSRWVLILLATSACPDLSAALAARGSVDRYSNFNVAAPTGTGTSSDKWHNLRTSHRPTDAPKQELGAWQDLRREVGAATCGFFPESGDPYDCGPSRICTNSGNYRRCCSGRECSQALPTACVGLRGGDCPEGGTICCQSPLYCATFLWQTSASPNKIFTILDCDQINYPEPISILAEPRNAAPPAAAPTTPPAAVPNTTPAPAAPSTRPTTLQVADPPKQQTEPQVAAAPSTSLQNQADSVDTTTPNSPTNPKTGTQPDESKSTAPSSPSINSASSSSSSTIVPARQSSSSSSGGNYDNSNNTTGSGNNNSGNSNTNGGTSPATDQNQSTPNSSNTNSSSSTTSTSAIAGGVVGGLAVIGFIVVALYWLRMRRVRAAAAAGRGGLRSYELAGDYSSSGSPAGRWASPSSSPSQLSSGSPEMVKAGYAVEMPIVPLRAELGLDNNKAELPGSDGYRE